MKKERVREKIEKEKPVEVIKENENEPNRLNMRSKHLGRRVKDLILSQGYPCNPKSTKQPVYGLNRSLKLPYRFKNNN